GAITSLTLSQVRRRVFGSCASARQKLLTKSDCRVLRMSSKTARASGESSLSESSFTVAMVSSRWFAVICRSRHSTHCCKALTTQSVRGRGDDSHDCDCDCDCDCPPRLTCSTKTLTSRVSRPPP